MPGVREGEKRERGKKSSLEEEKAANSLTRAWLCAHTDKYFNIHKGKAGRRRKERLLRIKPEGKTLESEELRGEPGQGGEKCSAGKCWTWEAAAGFMEQNRGPYSVSDLHSHPNPLLPFSFYPPPPPPPLPPLRLGPAGPDSRPLTFLCCFSQAGSNSRSRSQSFSCSM